MRIDQGIIKGILQIVDTLRAKFVSSDVVEAGKLNLTNDNDKNNPLITIDSQIKNTNLNADLVDNLHVDVIIDKNTISEKNNELWSANQIKNYTSQYITENNALTTNSVPVYDSSNKQIKDSGLTIESSVPRDAVFTDTTYNVATTQSIGLVRNGGGYVSIDPLTGIISITDDSHRHDARYYTKNEIDNKQFLTEHQSLDDYVTHVKLDSELGKKSDVGHNHDSTYEPKNSNIQAHILNSNVHVTLDDKAKWNAKETPSGAQEKATKALADSKTYTDNKVSDLINGASETLDTLKEIEEAFAENDEIIDAINMAISERATKEELLVHINDLDFHLSQEELDIINDIYAKNHTHANLNILNNITSQVYSNFNTAYNHVSDTDKHITSTERANLNAAYNHSLTSHARADATKVEPSTVNGHIKINGTDITVFTESPDGIATESVAGNILSGGDLEIDSTTGIATVESVQGIESKKILYAISSFSDIHDIVKSGNHVHVFEIGDKFQCLKNSDTVTFSVTGFNKQLLYSYNYILDEAISIGTYNISFSVDSTQYEYNFTLATALPINAKLVFNFNTKKVSTYSNNTSTTIIETVTLNESLSRAGTTLFDQIYTMTLKTDSTYSDSISVFATNIDSELISVCGDIYYNSSVVKIYEDSSKYKYCTIV